MKSQLTLLAFLWLSIAFSQDAFITTWKTDNPGFSEDNQITIPTFSGEIYDYSVDWGDGTNDTNITSDITHTYATAGTYTVSITGIFPRIYFNETGDKDKLLNITQWGNIAWSSMESAFAGCNYLSVAANDSPDLSNVTSLRRMFYYCNYSFDMTWSREFKNFNGVESFNNWDVSTITDMANMFDKSTFGQEISSWDVSNVTDMSYLFHSTQHFNHDISNWDVGNVVSMEATFGSSSFNSDITSWNVSSVTNMNAMFNGAPFDQDITQWDVSNVIYMSSMFNRTKFDKDLSSWDVGNVITFYNIFDYSDLSRENYDKILIAWSQLPSLQYGVELGAIQVQYCMGEEARNELINNYNWTIIDQGQYCEEESPFITTWKTDNPGASINNQITIPTNPFENYEYTVDWGDGTKDTGVTGDITHTYDSPGTYQVSISGRFPYIFFNNPDAQYPVGTPRKDSDKEKIISIDQWGNNRWSDMSFSFAGCKNLDILATDTPNFSRNKALIYTFYECSSLVGSESFVQWDLGESVYLDGMFSGASSFNQPIGNWNMSNFRYFRDVFKGASSFNQNLEHWNFENVQTMEGMFDGSGMSVDNYDKLLTALLESSTINNNIIFGAENLNYCIGETARQSLIDNYDWTINDAGKDCSETYFITTWKTDNPGISGDNQITIPTYPGETYNYIVDWGDGTSDINVIGDITHTYTTPGTYVVSIAGTFPRIYFNYYPSAPDSIKGDESKIISINQWGDIKWKSMLSAFEGCENLDMQANDIPDLTLVTSLGAMFRNCNSLSGNETFSNWKVDSISNFSRMFEGAELFNQDLSKWNTSNAIFMSDMFAFSDSFNGKISNWDVRSVENMQGMFLYASKFNQPIGNWDTGSVTNMNELFTGATSFNQDLSGWDVSNVEDMGGMFYGAYSFNQNINNWDVGRVEKMNFMFREAKSFNQPLNNWDVGNVIHMSSMFEGAFEFNQDLSNWDISNLLDMGAMFLGTGLSLENYDKTLIGWSSLSALQNNVVFDGGTSQYCESEEARQYIIDTYGWNITDGGKVPFCNEDNDFDGILDHKDACLNTLPGVSVNENGCEVIAQDAILVYGLTPTCPGQSNGSIQISSTLTNHSYNISLAGPTNSTSDGVLLDEPLVFENLPSGIYTVDISIPDVSYSQTFGIQINEVGSISGKRENLDIKSKSVSYSVEGSYSYKANINGQISTFDFVSTGPNQIVLNGLEGPTDISITGESDCQGFIEDSFNFSESVVMYPINTKNKVYIEGYDKQSEVQIFDISGRLLFQKQLGDENLESLDFQSYHTGIYPVKIISNQETQTFKIVKE